MGLDNVLNRRSTPYKTLGLATKKITKAKAIELILEDPNLLKRPLVLKGKRYVLGWKPEELGKL